MSLLRRYPDHALDPEINERKTRTLANRHNAPLRRISKFPFSTGVSCRTHGYEFPTLLPPLLGSHLGYPHRVPRS